MSVEQDDNIIELVDEEGEEVKVQVLYTIEKDGKQYIVVEFLDEDGQKTQTDDEENTEVYILEVVNGEGENCEFIPVEDDDLLDELFDEFEENFNQEVDDQ